MFISSLSIPLLSINLLYSADWWWSYLKKIEKRNSVFIFSDRLSIFFIKMKEE